MSREKPDPVMIEESRRLRAETFEDLARFSYNGLVTEARVTRVIDGDTIEVVFFYRGQPEKHVLRIAGIDAPEKKPPKKLFSGKNGERLRQRHIEAANIVRREVEKLILGKIVQIDLLTEEKFNRLLGLVFANELQFASSSGKILYTLDIADFLISKQLAKTYTGRGRKSQFTAQEIEYICELK